MDYIRWFDEISAEDVEIVGGKGANLGEMASVGLPVPPGFCLTAKAYRDFIRLSDLKQPIEKILLSMRQEDPASIEMKASEIRNLITQQPIPVEVVDKLLESYKRLNKDLHGNENQPVPVAVRSSATAEDLPTASFAGQQDTYLNVQGEQHLLEKIKACWASLWTTRAVSYRTKQGFDHHKVYLAVVVQAMIPSDISGIMFTVNPITGDREQAVVNASWGLGEAIVSGLVTPDTITLNKEEGIVVSQQIASKERMIVYGDIGGIVELETAPELREIPTLTDDQLATLVKIGNRIEKHYGSPQDIEWACCRDEFYILQSRPITTLDKISELPADGMEYNRTMFIEIFPDPLSPVFQSVMLPLLKSMLDFTFEAWGFHPPEGMKGAKGFYNQPYFNRNYIEKSLEPLPVSVREPLVDQITNPFGRHDQGSTFSFSPAYLRMVARMLVFLVRFPKQLPFILESYRAEVNKLVSLPLDDVSDREILEKIEVLVYEDASKLLNYDFLMIAVIGRTYRLLSALLKGFYDQDSEELCAKLISGVTGNVTMETNKQIWDLAQIAKGFPVVREVLKKYDEAEVRAHLKTSIEGRNFLRALDRFLDKYGHREVRMDIIYPTWGENEVPVLSFIKAYLDSDETQSPHWQQERLVKEREDLTEKVIARVKEHLQGRYLILPIFKWLLKQAQIHTRERDTMHFELTRLFPPIRRLLLELGQRWRKMHLINSPDDVFYLTLDELMEFTENLYPIKEKIQLRREGFESNKARPWPDIIRNGEEIYLERADFGERSDGAMKGIPGSPGRVTGMARVIRNPDEFEKLQKGDILVAPLTNPVWTPLFAIASGVITEVGGILSHGAIVAREYGIPAVMSVGDATEKIVEGQTITVDGNVGLVMFEEGVEH